MQVNVIKTRKVLPKSCTLLELLDESLTDMPNNSVLAIAAKVPALCEGRVVPFGTVKKDELVAQESEYYIPSNENTYGVSLAVNNGNLVAAAGVDESNGNGHYVLWPSDLQAVANEVRAYLVDRFGHRNLGVIITDSTTRPLQWGTTGIAIAHSGFEPLKDYIGTSDLFGRTFEYHKNNLRNGLAAAAVLVMGEGDEQTPLAVLSDLPMVTFTARDPNVEELQAMRITLQEDLYARFLQSPAWRPGKKNAS